MSDIVFQKPIFFNESFEDKNLIEDYKTKYDYLITIIINPEMQLIINNIKNLLDNNNTFLKNTNPDCISEGINQNKDSFINRLYEILSLKLFGDARYTQVFNKDNNQEIYEKISMDIIESINCHKDDLKNHLIDKDILETNNSELIENEYVLKLKNTNILLPFTFSGELLELEEGLKVLFESTSYGGAQIVDGKYNIPLLLQIKRTV